MDRTPGFERENVAGRARAGPRVDFLTGTRLDERRPLMWRRSGPFARDLVLSQGDAIVGELEPLGGGAARWAGECFGSSLEVRLEEAGSFGVLVSSELAGGAPGPSYRGPRPGWGRIETPAGQTLPWRPFVLGLDQQRLVDSKGSELIRMRPPFFHLGGSRAQVLVRPAGWSRSDLSELLLLTACLRQYVRSVRHITLP